MLTQYFWGPFSWNLASNMNTYQDVSTPDFSSVSRWLHIGAFQCSLLVDSKTWFEQGILDIGNMLTLLPNFGLLQPGIIKLFSDEWRKSTFDTSNRYCPTTLNVISKTLLSSVIIQNSFPFFKSFPYGSKRCIIYGGMCTSVPSHDAFCTAAKSFTNPPW